MFYERGYARFLKSTGLIFHFSVPLMTFVPGVQAALERQHQQELHEAARVEKASRELLECYANVINRLNNKFVAWEDALVAAEATRQHQRAAVR